MMNEAPCELKRLCDVPCVIEIADSLPSTNTVLKGMAVELPHGYTLSAREQTAGRGQRGNTWESEPGMNLTFSILLRPRHIAPARQFVISEAVAVGISEAIDPLLPAGMETRIKWPNDIYVGDRKICGILIEHTIGSAAAISYTVAGAGINVNQRRFLSDAPNPVSLWQLTAAEHDTEAFLKNVAEEVLREFEGVDGGSQRAASDLHRRFMAKLWRNDGRLHPFRLPDGTDFLASIGDVAPDGRLTLVDREGKVRRFYFKEVAFVL